MKRAGARTLFCTLSQNFSDWPPPASLHRAGLGPDEQREWERVFAEGRRLAAGGDCNAAQGAFEQALAIDDRYADLQFRAATCLRQLGRLTEAKQRFRLASDLDPCTRRVDHYFNEIIERVAGRRGLSWVIVSRTRAPGRSWATTSSRLRHPNLRRTAHRGGVSDAMREEGVPRADEQWRGTATSRDGARALIPGAAELRILELETRVFVCSRALASDARGRARILELQKQNGCREKKGVLRSGGGRRMTGRPAARSRSVRRACLRPGSRGSLERAGSFARTPGPTTLQYFPPLAFRALGAAACTAHRRARGEALDRGARGSRISPGRARVRLGLEGPSALALLGAALGECATGQLLGDGDHDWQAASGMQFRFPTWRHF